MLRLLRCQKTRRLAGLAGALHCWLALQFPGGLQVLLDMGARAGNVLADGGTGCGRASGGRRSRRAPRHGRRPSPRRRRRRTRLRPAPPCVRGRPAPRARSAATSALSTRRRFGCCRRSVCLFQVARMFLVHQVGVGAHTLVDLLAAGLLGGGDFLLVDRHQEGEGLDLRGVRSGHRWRGCRRLARLAGGAGCRRKFAGRYVALPLLAAGQQHQQDRGEDGGVRAAHAVGPGIVGSGTIEWWRRPGEWPVNGKLFRRRRAVFPDGCRATDRRDCRQSRRPRNDRPEDHR